MIEGWRHSPWFLNAVRREPDAMEQLADCSLCMRTNDAMTRSLMGCGYEPPAAGARPWSPPSGAHGFRGETLHCPGYTTRLPEVIEAQRAHAHWEKGELTLFCGDDKPDEMLLDGILILDHEREAVRAWGMTPVEEGGGRE